MTDHTALKEAAERATPGPWDVMEDETYCGGFGCTPDGCYGHSTGKGTWVDGPHIVEFFEGAGILIDEDLTEDEQAKLDKEAYDQACADAHFIALANPSKILELLAENEALREDKAELIESFSKLQQEVVEALHEVERLKGEGKDLTQDVEAYHSDTLMLINERNEAQSENASLREQLREMREALDIIEQNCEASASSYEARIKTIHGVIRLYSKREEAG